MAWLNGQDQNKVPAIDVDNVAQANEFHSIESETLFSSDPTFSELPILVARANEFHLFGSHDVYCKSVKIFCYYPLIAVIAEMLISMRARLRSESLS